MTTMVARAERAEPGRDPRAAMLPGEIAVSGSSRVGIQAAACREARMWRGDGETKEYGRAEKKAFHSLNSHPANHST
jgi:hypothetical protein